MEGQKSMKLETFPDQETFLKYAQRGNVVPVCMETLADTETPVSAMAKIRKANGGGPQFLLESVEGGERWGRYSFLGASAYRQIRVYRDYVEVEGPDARDRIRHYGDPFIVLRSIMAPYRPVTLPEVPRFWGGLVGHLNYEMVSFIEAIPHEWPADQPLARFLMTDELFIFDNVRQTLTLVAHVFLDDKSDAQEGYRGALARLESMRAAITRTETVPAAPHRDAGSGRIEPSLDDETFRSRVARIIEYIHDGEAIQTVFSQPFTCEAPPDACWLYRALRYVNPSPYMFFFHMDDMVLVGSSPESMVRLENGIATLRPIAGTRPRGATEQEDRQLANEMLQDPKERAEHLMLVDLGRNDLGRVAEVGTLEVTDLMVVERYSHVMHLVSNIRCALVAGCDVWDLLVATFPAGTLSGAPKVRAMEIIAELENHPRGPYGGAVGHISFTGNMDLAIVIRTASIHDGKLTVQAGAGIVADSDPEKEREEVVNKAQALQKALGLIQQGSE
jgi:anthranilate synthase component 1